MLWHTIRILCSLLRSALIMFFLKSKVELCYKFALFLVSYKGHLIIRASLVVKNSPASAGDACSSLVLGDPLEKEWLPTPVFLPAKSHGQGSLACGVARELDTT